MYAEMELLNPRKIVMMDSMTEFMDVSQDVQQEPWPVLLALLILHQFVLTI